MYKKALRLGLRFQTSRGVLTVEQLWQLTLTELANTIKLVKKTLTKDNDDDLSFLDSNKVVDTENELRFEILKDVYITKKDENEQLRTAAENKAYNQKILNLIAEKQEENLKSMSVSELEALLKNNVITH